jgi:ABC-type antimicrobial peptide transport system permease subunit
MTLPQSIRENLVLDVFVGTLSGAFAVLATLLAALGVYGVLSYALTQRTREIGLKLALGAAPGRVQAALLGQAGRMFLIGGSIGLLLALALGRAAQALLYQLEGHDLRVLLGASVVLAGIALLAAWWPARRAARVDPLVALRWE